MKVANDEVGVTNPRRERAYLIANYIIILTKNTRKATKKIITPNLGGTKFEAYLSMASNNGDFLLKSFIKVRIM